MTLKRDAAWLALVVIGVLFAFGAVLGPEDGLYFGDHTMIFRRRWYWVADALARGELPVRTIASLSGTPLEDLLNGTYTPMTLVLLLGDFDIVYDLFVAGHVLLLAVGAFGFARSLGATGLMAAGAASVALMGPVLSFENLLVGLQGLAWAPWVWWAVGSVLRRPSWLGVAALGLVGGFHVQAIMPETALLDLLAGAVLLMVVVSRGELTAPAKSLGGLVCGLGLAALISAVELMPVLEALRFSRRGSGFTAFEHNVWAVQPLGLLDLLAPGLGSLHSLPFAESVGVHAGKRRAYLVSLYLGLTPALGLVALTDPRHRRLAIVLVVIAVAGVVLALGDLTPLHGLVRGLPVLRNGRFPVKFLLLTSAALAALVPLGLRALRSAPGAGVLALGGYLALVASLYFTLSVPEVRPFVEELSRFNGNFPTIDRATKLDLVMSDLRFRTQSSLLAASLAFVSVAAAAGSKRRSWAPALTVTALWLGLVLGARATIVSAPTGPQPPPEFLEALRKSDRYYQVLPNGQRVPLEPEPGVDLYAQHVASGRVRGGLILPEGRFCDDFDPDGQSQPMSVFVWSLVKRSSGASAERLLGRAGVHWISLWLDLDRPGKIELPMENQPPHYLYPLPRTRAPVSAHASWIRVGKDIELGPELARFLKSDETFEQIVIGDPSAPTSTSTSALAAASCDAATSIVAPPDTRGDLIAVKVEAACPVMLLVLEKWAPQWQAKVDGAPVPVYPGGVGDIAVHVPEGRHEVVLRFEARSERWLPVSLGGLLIAAALIAVGVIRRRARAAR